MKKAPHDRVQELVARFRYRPGYRFEAFGGFGAGSSIEISTEHKVQDSADPMAGGAGTITDGWENSRARRLDSLEEMAVETLQAAIACAIHEVFEWFSLDGRRLIDAHSDLWSAKQEEVAYELARWAWRQRKKCPGAPYPRIGDLKIGDLKT